MWFKTLLAKMTSIFVDNVPETAIVVARRDFAQLDDWLHTGLEPVHHITEERHVIHL